MDHCRIGCPEQGQSILGTAALRRPLAAERSRLHESARSPPAGHRRTGTETELAHCRAKLAAVGAVPRDDGVKGPQTLRQFAWWLHFRQSYKSRPVEAIEYTRSANRISGATFPGTQTSVYSALADAPAQETRECNRRSHLAESTGGATRATSPDYWFQTSARPCPGY